MFVATKTMTPLFMIVVVSLLLLFLTSSPYCYVSAFSQGRPSPKMEKFHEEGEAATFALETCLHAIHPISSSSDNTPIYHTEDNSHDRIMCYVKAIATFPFNVTWHKSLGATLLDVGCPRQGLQALNHSVYEVLRVQGYTKQPLLMKDDAATAIRLYAARDKLGGLEMVKTILHMQHAIGNFVGVRQFYTNYSDVSLDSVELESVGEQLAAEYARALFSTVQIKRALPFTPENATESARLHGALLQALSHFSRYLLEAPLFPQRVDALMSSDVTPLCFQKDAKLREIVRMALTGGGTSMLTLNNVVRLMLSSSCTKDFEDLFMHTRVHRPHGVINTTLVHLLARLGAMDMLGTIFNDDSVPLSLRQELLRARTFHGQTPLHIAVLAGRTDVAALFMKILPNAAAIEDQSGYSPRRLFCEHRYYGKEMERTLRMVGTGICDDVEERRDDEPVISSNQGGWGTAAKGKKLDIECDIDVRDAASLLPIDFMGYYIVQEKPVMLRGAIPLKQRQKAGWTKKRLMATPLARTWRMRGIEADEYDGGAVAGNVILNVSTLKKTSEDTVLPPGDAAMRGMTLQEFDETSHYQIVSERVSLTSSHQPWRDMVKALRPDGTFDSAYTHLLMGNSSTLSFIHNKTARTARVHLQPTYMSLAFGAMKWEMFTPNNAHWTRTAMDKNKGTNNNSKNRRPLRCTQYPGDVLIIPQMWGTRGRADLASGTSILLEGEFNFGVGHTEMRSDRRGENEEL